MKEVNGRIHLSMSSYIKLGLTISGMIWLGAVAWTTLKNGVAANAAEINKAVSERLIMETDDKLQTTNIVTLQTQMTSVEEKIDKIQFSTEKTNNLVQRIAGRMGVE